MRKEARFSSRVIAAVVVTAVLLLYLPSARATSKTTLELMFVSGDIVDYRQAYSPAIPEDLHFRWSTGENGVASARWRVTTVAASGAVVAASGPTPAPATGHAGYFTIPKNAFLAPSPPASPKNFYITVTPYDAKNQPLGEPSSPVLITQTAAQGGPQVQFGGSAAFASLAIVAYDEKIGIVPLTQIHFAGADVTIRVSNPGRAPTDPAWLSVEDHNGLMRQSGPMPINSLGPGASQVVTVHLDAILPPSRSQLESQRHWEWEQAYRDRCGVDLRGVMDWRGPQNQAPLSAHRETILVEEGWSDYTKSPSGAPICDGRQCADVCQIAKNIHAQLDGHAVGYAFFVGQYPKFGAYGQARTDANGPAAAFTKTTKITVASVSKMVTTIAAVRILDKYGVSLDAPIGPYLPSDWSVSKYVQSITFSQLLSQQSGIKDYGNVTQDYSNMKLFFSQAVSAGTTTTCQGPPVHLWQNAFNMNNASRCYSNYNFGIFRVLLPRVAGFVEDPNPDTRPQTLADQYVKLVQQNVFEPVGQKDVACRPPHQAPAVFTYAFGYTYPGNKPGYDWGDRTLSCGADGWYLSVEDIAKVFLSLNAKDGKVLSEAEFQSMRTRQLGWDVRQNTELEKNGTWGAAGGSAAGSITTSVAIFGPVAGPRLVGVLFINSDISGGPSSGGGAQGVLESAYNSALKTY